MFESGVPLLRALEQLGQQSESARLRFAALSMARGLAGGQALSRAMQSTGVFTDVQQRLVASGELSGRLGSVLGEIARHEEERAALSQQLRARLVAPLSVCLACLLLVVTLPPLCLRGLLTMISELGISMPWPTLVLLRLSQALSSPFFYAALLASGAALAAASKRLGGDEEWRWRCSSWLLATPWLGQLLRLVAVVRFSETLASLLQSGILLLQALRVAAEASGNEVLRRSLEASQTALREGETLSSALAASGFFPGGFVQALRAGEESARVDAMLRDLAGLYRLELESRLATFTAALEPLVMSFIGLIVGFVCVAALLPMLQIVEGM